MLVGLGAAPAAVRAHKQLKLPSGRSERSRTRSRRDRSTTPRDRVRAHVFLCILA
jgi:hypothetical protein